MPDLSFHLTGIEVDRYAAVPFLKFLLEISNDSAGVRIANVILQCQIRIDATRRRYSAGEQRNLVELFGEPDRWSHNLHAMLWTYTQAAVPGFDTHCSVTLPVPCSFDFNIAATKYFHGLEDGEVPLLLLFSGTVFYQCIGADQAGDLQLAHISSDKETTWRLPVATWRQMMSRYYPDNVWLALSRDAFERLYRYKRESGLPSWEGALERLLRAASEEAA